MTEALALAVAWARDLGGLAGLAAVLAALPKLRTIGRDTAATAAQVTPNHGSSLRDAVARIERDVGGLRAEVRDLHRDDAATRARVDALADRLHRVECQ